MHIASRPRRISNYIILSAVITTTVTTTTAILLAHKLLVAEATDYLSCPLYTDR